MKFISTQTASGDTSVAFTSGIDTTYEEYIFLWDKIQVDAGTNYADFTFAINNTASTNYATVNKCATYWYTEYHEDTSGQWQGYATGWDGTVGTGEVLLCGSLDDAAEDATACGRLHLYTPSNTSYSKHFMAETGWSYYNPGSEYGRVAGIWNTGAAIDDVRFSISSGTFSGNITLYGVTK